MDITITGAEYKNGTVEITRSHSENGETWESIHRMPSWTLAARAAEYDLEPTDPFVLDLVLLEPFLVHPPEDVAPLHSAATVTEALATMRSRVEDARVAHGSPAGKNRIMAQAVKNGAASEGLVQAAELLSKYADPKVVPLVRSIRDNVRRTTPRETPMPNVPVPPQIAKLAR